MSFLNVPRAQLKVFMQLSDLQMIHKNYIMAAQVRPVTCVFFFLLTRFLGETCGLWYLPSLPKTCDKIGTQPCVAVNLPQLKEFDMQAILKVCPCLQNILDRQPKDWSSVISKNEIEGEYFQLPFAIKLASDAASVIQKVSCLFFRFFFFARHVFFFFTLILLSSLHAQGTPRRTLHSAVKSTRC